MCEFVSPLRMVFVFHLRVRASSLLMILSKMLSLEHQDCVRDGLVRGTRDGYNKIIDVLFAFGVDLPTTPTQPWHNLCVCFSRFSTWSIIIFNHCTVSAYRRTAVLHNGGGQSNETKWMADYTRSRLHENFFSIAIIIIFGRCVSVTFSADFSLALYFRSISQH